MKNWWKFGENQIIKRNRRESNRKGKNKGSFGPVPVDTQTKTTQISFFFLLIFLSTQVDFCPLHCLKTHPKPPTSYITTPFAYQFKAQLVFTKISFLYPNSLELVISKVPLVFWSSRSQFTKRDSSVLLVSSKFPLVLWNCIFVCKTTAWPKMIASLKM